MHEDVRIIEGKLFTDERGSLSCVNDFNFLEIKRFYQLRHVDISVVRAWQGHKFEHKYFYVPYGSFIIGWVKIDDFDHPSIDLTAEQVVLSADRPRILHVPA